MAVSLIPVLTSRRGGSGSGVTVDALPYIDTEYEEPGMKEMVSLIAGTF